MAITDKAIISTDKHWEGRSAEGWSNTYELDFIGGFPGATLAKEILEALVEAERFLHIDVVRYSGARMARYVAKTVYPVPDEDEPPYDPTNTIPYITNATGTRAIPAFDGVEPKDIILWVNRAGDYGIPGTIEFRGCLFDSQVQDTDGDWSLIDPLPMETLVTGFRAAMLAIEANYDCKFSLMGEPQTSATYQMVGKKKIKLTATYGPTYVIPITSMSVRGVRPDKATKRWYNRV